MDATQLSFADSSFDLVLEKSLLDTFLCMPLSTRVGTIAQYFCEVLRVLRVGGIFLCISFGKPEDRLPHLQRAGFVVTVREIQTGQPHQTWVCICHRTMSQDQEDLHVCRDAIAH